MLFFNRFKQGKYGRFYGTVDPLVIMTALQEFLRERSDAIVLHERERQRLKRVEMNKGNVSYEEYKKLKGQTNQIKVQQ